MKRIVSLVLCLCLCLMAAACAAPENTGSDETPEATLTIAYQGGIGYAPIHVMEKQQLIEKAYDGKVTVTYQKLDSGASINEGLIGGTIQIGCMGIAPAVSAVSAGVPCKILSNLTAQPHGLMSNDPAITGLSDIKDTDKIALVNTGSIQHILLAMAAEKELGDAHALDNNIQAMAHAEGMAALESGTVKLHLTSSPFINQERESGKYTELSAISEVWPVGNSFLVAMAATSLESDNPALFEAVKTALSQAIAYINEDEDGTVAIESEYLALDEATVRGYLQDEACQYFPELRGVTAIADFMYRAAFIEKAVTLSELKFDFVTGD